MISLNDKNNNKNNQDFERDRHRTGHTAPHQKTNNSLVIHYLKIKNSIYEGSFFYTTKIAKFGKKKTFILTLNLQTPNV